MKRTRGRIVQIDSLAGFDRRLAAGARSLSGWQVRSLDLSGRTEQLARTRVAGATFLGCTFAVGDSERLEAAGALVLPTIPDVPVDVYRSELYQPGELYDDARYARSLDARAYAWSQSVSAGSAGRPSVQHQEATLAHALHDHSIDQALARWTASRRLVGVMGGHALTRGEEGYADAARLGQRLGTSYAVATGGGPGAMEAANLGCWLARRSEDELGAALAMLAAVPSFRPVEAWVRVAFEVRERFPDGSDSLGIPTWHYGHEPSNIFCTAIAKYFRNATREATLLEVCSAGIVFLPGAGGTVQEVFQDACENYYADESSLAPMVLIGTTYWTETLPAWPLLERLAQGRPMEGHVHLVDSVEEAVAVLG